MKLKLHSLKLPQQFQSMLAVAIVGVAIVGVALFSSLGLTSPAFAEDAMVGTPPKNSLAPHPSMKENEDGNLKQGEYEVISTNGSVTRAFCPYTCEMRGLPAKNCKSWKSLQEPDKCYLQDTRLPSNAVPMGKGN